MVSAIRQRVTVQPGGRIEIRSSELPAGAEAEVIVVLETAPPAPTHSLRDLIGQGKGCYATPQDADHFIRGERNAWES